MMAKVNGRRVRWHGLFKSAMDQRSADQQNHDDDDEQQATENAAAGVDLRDREFRTKLTHDSLSGLPNRSYFCERVRAAFFSASNRRRRRRGAGCGISPPTSWARRSSPPRTGLASS